MRTPIRWALLAFVGLAAAAAPVCKVPVFRYALERWPSAHYEAFVFHRGSLGDAPLRALEMLDKAGTANLTVHPVDLSVPMTEIQRRVWLDQPNPTLPWAVLLKPGDVDEPRVVWSGAFHERAARSLVESPVRKEVARRILAGESVVWVLLEGGDRAADDAAASLLRAELLRLERTIELPDAQPQGDQPGVPGLLSAVPLRLAFSTIRVAREDVAEKMLVSMLLGVEERLAKAGGPMVFPVFGRGRVLGPLVGKEINAEVLEEAALFMTGPCSCQVKELNPGVDLLISADWDSFVGRIKDDEAVPLPALALDPTPAPRRDTAGSDGVRQLLWFGIWVVSFLVVGTGIRLFKRRARA